MISSSVPIYPNFQQRKTVEAKSEKIHFGGSPKEVSPKDIYKRNTYKKYVPELYKAAALGQNPPLYEALKVPTISAKDIKKLVKHWQPSNSPENQQVIKNLIQACGSRPHEYQLFEKLKTLISVNVPFESNSQAGNNEFDLLIEAYPKARTGKSTSRRKPSQVEDDTTHFLKCANLLLYKKITPTISNAPIIGNGENPVLSQLKALCRTLSLTNGKPGKNTEKQAEKKFNSLVQGTEYGYLNSEKTIIPNPKVNPSDYLQFSKYLFNNDPFRKKVDLLEALKNVTQVQLVAPVKEFVSKQVNKRAQNASNNSSSIPPKQMHSQSASISSQETFKNTKPIKSIMDVKSKNDVIPYLQNYDARHISKAIEHLTNRQVQLNLNLTQGLENDIYDTLHDKMHDAINQTKQKSETMQVAYSRLKPTYLDAVELLLTEHIWPTLKSTKADNLNWLCMRFSFDDTQKKHLAGYDSQLHLALYNELPLQ